MTLLSVATIVVIMGAIIFYFRNKYQQAAKERDANAKKLAHIQHDLESLQNTVELKQKELDIVNQQSLEQQHMLDEQHEKLFSQRNQMEVVVECFNAQKQMAEIKNIQLKDALERLNRIQPRN